MNRLVLALAFIFLCFSASAKELTSKSYKVINPPGNAHRGAKLFEKATCSFCHPCGGNAVNPSKTLYGKNFNKRYPDDQALVKVIRNGIKGTAMQSFAKDKLSDTELTDVIAYIRSLSKNSLK